jgi:hypothetical protein
MQNALRGLYTGAATFQSPGDLLRDPKLKAISGDEPAKRTPAAGKTTDFALAFRDVYEGSSDLGGR